MHGVVHGTLEAAVAGRYGADVREAAQVAP